MGLSIRDFNGVPEIYSNDYSLEEYSSLINFINEDSRVWNRINLLAADSSYKTEVMPLLQNGGVLTVAGLIVPEFIGLANMSQRILNKLEMYPLISGDVGTFIKKYGLVLPANLHIHDRSRLNIFANDFLRRVNIEEGRDGGIKYRLQYPGNDKPKSLINFHSGKFGTLTEKFAVVQDASQPHEDEQTPTYISPTGYMTLFLKQAISDAKTNIDN